MLFPHLFGIENFFSGGRRAQYLREAERLLITTGPLATSESLRDASSVGPRSRGCDDKRGKSELFFLPCALYHYISLFDIIYKLRADMAVGVAGASD